MTTIRGALVLAGLILALAAGLPTRSISSWSQTRPGSASWASRWAWFW
ncbi:MAG: hypothetical protein ACE5GX_15000 [Thermoanaerobaculia bacterium]